MVPRRQISRRRSIWDFLLTVLFVGILAISTAWLDRHNAEEISAVARVVDGDSLEMDDRKIRLVGIDAPELNQICQNKQGDFSCGIKAREHLRSLVGHNNPVECVAEGDDKYGRLLAECFVGGASLNATMVEDGWAISYGGFAWVERTARKEQRGLWAGEFDNPSDWRAKTGGLAEIQTGAILRGIWRQIETWFAALGED